MKTFIIDSFTNKLFKGNPAGVCFVESELSETTMLNIAKELNLSETAFIKPLGAAGQYAIRFFSPKMEIPLCGHATLASAKAVFTEYGINDLQFINIQNLELRVSVTNERITMTFPAYETEPAKAPAPLLAALGLPGIENAAFNKETNMLLLEIASSTELTALTPDFEALIRSHNNIHGVLVTAPASDTDSYDFHSRYFWPWSGSNEDPVTGATHTFLAKYWSRKLGKTKMKSFQASARTGFMDVELIGDQVCISSQAVIVLQGEMSI